LSEDLIVRTGTRQLLEWLVVVGLTISVADIEVHSYFARPNLASRAELHEVGCRWQKPSPFLPAFELYACTDRSATTLLCQERNEGALPLDPAVQLVCVRLPLDLDKPDEYR
jgi:hypothetical protein